MASKSSKITKKTTKKKAVKSKLSLKKLPKSYQYRKSYDRLKRWLSKETTATEQEK